MLRKPHIFSSHWLCFEVTRTCLQRHSVSIAWRLYREMRRWLILHKTGFTCERFLTSYFINMDTFHLFLNWFSTRVSDDQKYLCVHRLYMRINTPKFKDLDAREITSLPEIKKSDLRGTSFQSSWKINRILITRPMKVYNTRSPQFC